MFALFTWVTIFTKHVTEEVIEVELVSNIIYYKRCNYNLYIMETKIDYKVYVVPGLPPCNVKINKNIVICYDYACIHCA